MPPDSDAQPRPFQSAEPAPGDSGDGPGRDLPLLLFWLAVLIASLVIVFLLGYFAPD